jgi:hypothetical protein
MNCFARLGPDLNGVWAEGGKPDGQRRLSVSTFALLPFPFVPVVLQGSSVDTADRTADGDPVLKQKQIQRSILSFKDTFAHGHQNACQRDFNFFFKSPLPFDGGNMHCIHACVNTTLQMTLLILASPRHHPNIYLAGFQPSSRIL